MFYRMAAKTLNNAHLIIQIHLQLGSTLNPKDLDDNNGLLRGVDNAISDSVEAPPNPIEAG